MGVPRRETRKKRRGRTVVQIFFKDIFERIFKEFWEDIFERIFKEFWEEIFERIFFGDTGRFFWKKMLKIF